MTPRNDVARIRSDCRSFPKLGKVIGRGRSGTLYESASRKGQVVKVQPRSREHMLHQKMAALGVAPKYVARHVCTPLDLEAIVMERMQESATNWSIGKSLTARRRARNRILELVDAAHSAGVFHGDLHADQIMKRGDKWRLLNWGLAHRGNGGRTLPWWLGRKHFGGKRNQRAATVVSHALRLTPKTTVMEPLNVIDL